MARNKLTKAQNKRFDKKLCNPFGVSVSALKSEKRWKEIEEYGLKWKGDYRIKEVKQHLASELEEVEIWKDVRGYEGLYKVSVLGRVKGFQRGERIIKTALDKWGRPTFVLQKNGKRKTVAVHRIVARTFLPNPDNKPEINHIDGNKANNRIDNLEWNTRSENEKHAYRTGLKSQKGESNFRAKLTEEDVKEIKRISAVFSQKSIAKWFNVTPQCVGLICRGVNWKHV